MIKKLSKKLVALVCAIVLSFGVVGCTKTPTVNDSIDVWTTYNTMKVLRDVKYNGNYEKMEKGINVKMAKGEGEMGSFYVTTADVGVKDFNLEVAELKNSNGDVFPVENMEVYAQRYIEIAIKSRNNTYEAYPVGSFTPDAIVEMDLYRKAKENKIAPNSNQGFTVDFYTTQDTPAGVYTGTFVLTLDNKTIDIPVSVTVWDYAVPEKATAVSCVLIYKDCLIEGEKTSIPEEVDAWYKVYYETALKYRINPYMVPYSTSSPQLFIENVLKYYDHPNFTSIGLPHQTFLSKYPQGTYEEEVGVFILEDGSTDKVKQSRYGDCLSYWYDSLYLLAQKAKENNENYFEKCYFYPIDEPNGEDQLKIAVEWFEDLKDLKNHLADKVVADGLFSADDPIVASIRDIDIVCTALGDEPRIAGYDIVYVPEPFEIEDYSVQTTIEQHAKANGDNPIWYYTQIDKIGDGPNAFRDDYLVAGRLQGWLEQYYNIDGWLYWEFAGFLSKIAFKAGYEVYDMYNETQGPLTTVQAADGGGMWVYPALKYGASEPIKTLRLLACRDGQEERETLNYLDQKYKEYENYYAVEEGSFDINKVFKGVYDKLFCRSSVYRDDATFDVCRDVLKDAVINANNSEEKFIYTMDYVGKNATYNFYTAPGYQVKVGENLLTSSESGSGLKHTYTIDASTTSVLASIELIKGGQSKTVELYEVQSERAIDMNAEGFTVSVSEGSSFTNNGNVFDFTIKSNADDDYFLPQIKFTGLPSRFNVIELDIENKTDELVEMDLRITYSNGVSETKDIGLTANTSRSVEVLLRSLKDRTISSVSIRFKNKVDVNGNFVAVKDRDIVISGMRVR